MRLLVALVIPLILFGSVYAYVEFAERIRPAASQSTVPIDEANWTVRIERTFDCRGDADFGTPAIKVQFRGRDLLARSGLVKATEAITVDLSDVELGANDLYVETQVVARLGLEAGDSEFDSASSSEPVKQPPAAMRVRVFRNRQAVADKTFWQESTRRIVGTVEFSSSSTGDGTTQHKGHSP